MTKMLSMVTVVALSVGIIGSGALFSRPAFAQQDIGVPGIANSALQQMAAISAMKRDFTAGEAKMASPLVFAAKAARGELAGTAVAQMRRLADTDLASRVTVDIYGPVSAALVAAIAAADGVIADPPPSAGVVRASLPLGAIETVATHADVQSIQSAAGYVTNAGALTSQGYITHTANQVIHMGITGAGITVGVLSDSASPARVAALIASGDLPADTQVLPGQAGPSTGADEGAAMMEIVHDIAPGAHLIFATADGGVASFAANILALQAAGATVIVDDITYFNEGAFQDGPIARAVNQVTANGAIYFSAAANSGSLTFGTSGTWEGDFLPISTLHNFGGVASPQIFDVLTVASSRAISLKWSDPLGASTNDYDLFILDSAGATVKGFSVAIQNGTQDPLELIGPGTGCGTAAAIGYCPAVGDRIVVTLFAGAPRALRLDTHRGQLSINTAGSTFGHNAGASTVSTAATYWNSARIGTRPFTGATNPNETFSSDGPRQIFFTPDGMALTPGNVLFATKGGTTLQKPDLAAADGISTNTPGFLPFFGTSAAAPHAAAIAALIRSVQPDWTPAQVVNAMKQTALDSMAVGTDRDSGAGIAMAWPAVQYAFTHGSEASIPTRTGDTP